MSKNTFEIGYDAWRACGRGNVWNVRDKAGALLLETQAGYADSKLTAKDAKRIATLAASAPEMLAHLEKSVLPSSFENWGPEDWEAWNTKAKSIIAKARVEP